MKLLNSKVAFAISLILAGNVVVQSFIDDDNDYANNTTLKSGWGWLGINSANAAMSCDTDDNGGTRCSIVVDPCDVYNCNPPPPPPPYDPAPPPEDPPEDGGGGEGGADAPPVDPNLKDSDNDRKNDCWKGLVGDNATGINLSSDWGWRGYDFHPAWDIATAGQTGVKARFWGDAKVLNYGYDNNNGWYVEYETTLSKHFVKVIHLQSIDKGVERGKNYLMGDFFGVVGGTPLKEDGTNKYPIHLHMAIYSSEASYNESRIKRRAADTEFKKDLVDAQYSIDPANLFKNNICIFPSSVKSSNNMAPPDPDAPKPPCSNCSIP
ncbi:hypothetical protein [Rheinheimera sp.]|uniref:hypothetical protein n=1 Tax=Rheinheimera sp. TaxID=1869214 RepID=UPI002FDE56CF